jgi:hypothetical protein
MTPVPPMVLSRLVELLWRDRREGRQRRRHRYGSARGVRAIARRGRHVRQPLGGPGAGREEALAVLRPGAAAARIARSLLAE